jgi:hypothetical protein
MFLLNRRTQQGPGLTPNRMPWHGCGVSGDDLWDWIGVFGEAAIEQSLPVWDIVVMILGMFGWTC